jgi:hypothetical protein
MEELKRELTIGKGSNRRIGGLMHCSDHGVNRVAEWTNEDDGTIRHQSSWMIQWIDEEGQQIVFGECCEQSPQIGKITITFSHTICPISFPPF